MKASSGESEPLSPKAAVPSSPPQQPPAGKLDEPKPNSSEEKYYNFFLNAADIVAVIDLDANLVDINLKVEAELGVSREELIGRNLTVPRWLTQESADRIRLHLREIAEGRAQAVFEVNARARDGALVPFEVNAVPIREGGVVKAVQANLRNIRDRHQKEQALRNSEETTRVLLNAASNAAFLIDTGGIVLAGRPRRTLLEISTNGILRRYIDISVADPTKPSGLEFAPRSNKPAATSLYIADCGADAMQTSDQNDRPGFRW